VFCCGHPSQGKVVCVHDWICPMNAGPLADGGTSIYVNLPLTEMYIIYSPIVEKNG
jgi:hypothetical protein